MKELLEEISETLKKLLANSEYQTKLWEEATLYRDEQSKQKEQVRVALDKYREMIRSSGIMRSSPEVGEAIDKLFDGIAT